VALKFFASFHMDIDIRKYARFSGTVTIRCLVKQKQVTLMHAEWHL